jgi:CIC family chloride channel protein
VSARLAVGQRLKGLTHRGQRDLILAGITGVVVGLGVAAFEWVTREQLYERLTTTPLVVQAGVPVVGLAVAALALWWLAAGASPSTADEYIENFHQLSTPLPLKPVVGRIVAGIATLGSGGALGFEGPSLYLGAAVGSTIQRRWARRFSSLDPKVLMVAGAAAGVAAIFKAPATGAIFALEVPYQDDTAHHMLLPALIAAATSYLTYVAILGTTPLFAVNGSPPFDLRDLGGALMLGLVCGVGARLFSVLVRAAKHISKRGHPAVRVAIAGSAYAALFASSYALIGDGAAGGAGYDAIDRIADPHIGLGLLLGLLAVRLAANFLTLAGGGAGGLFIPLVVAGAIVGKICGLALGDPSGSLFPLIGVAAFLGAGYRTPLAGVVFVAESTGRASFIVPGLIASVAAQLMMGHDSVSAYQLRTDEPEPVRSAPHATTEEDKPDAEAPTHPRRQPAAGSTWGRLRFRGAVRAR